MTLPISSPVKTSPRLTVYKASAGSGKTFTLAIRYVALLLSGVSHRSILAVTFTNKATAEMKDRILSYLFRMAFHSDESDAQSLIRAAEPFVRQHVDAGVTGRPPRSYAEMARFQLSRILDDYNHFSITTIDSFLQLLMGETARMAGLGTNFKIELNDEDVRRAAIDRVMSGYKQLSPDARSAILEMVERQMDNESGWDVRRKMMRLSRQLSNEAYLRGRKGMEGVSLKDYRRAVENMELRKEVDEALGLIDRFNATYLKADGVKYGKNVDTFVRRYAESLKGKARKSDFFVPLSASAAKGLGDEKWFSSYSGPGTPEEYLRIVNQLQESMEACKFYVINTELTLSHLDELGLLETIRQEMARINEENNRMLLSETPIRLRELLEQGADTMFVLEKAGIRYRHVMIDEFQDTSGMQWDNFVPLLDEVMAAGGTTLLVGDVKQSIYRWRGGNWEILQGLGRESAPAQGAASSDGAQVQVLSLTRNWRSGREIVAFNLDFFQRASRYVDGFLSSKAYGQGTVSAIYDEAFLAENLSQFYASGHEGGHVDVKLFPYLSKTEREANELILEQLFQDLISLHVDGLPYGEMMILVRGSKEAALIVDYLARHKQDEGFSDLTITSADAYRLDSSVSVNMLVCALRFMVNSSDRIAQTYLVKHYQQDILGRKDLDWDDFCRHADQLMPPGLLALCGQSTDHLPLYDLLYELARVLVVNADGRALLGDDAYLSCFFDQVLSFLDDYPSSPSLFLEHWEDRIRLFYIPAPARTDGVSMMTIHKAKGLEAHTVFLPMCHWGLKRDGEEIWCSPTVPPYDGLPILPVTTGYKMEESIYREDYRQELDRQLIDNLNLLYVAFTRPQNNLLVYSAVSAKSSDGLSTVGELVAQMCGFTQFDPPEDSEAWQEQAVLTGQKSVSASRQGPQRTDRFHPEVGSVEVPFTHCGERMNFRQSNESMRFLLPPDKDPDMERSRQDYILLGNLGHQVLSVIHTEADVDGALRSLSQQGMMTPSQERELRRLFAAAFGSPQVAGWFDGSWTVYREATILERRDGALCERRPDRVMMKDDETLVVDFKFGRPRAQYHEQVAEYMALLRRMGHARVKGYLWYVREARVEEVTPKTLG